ncbi:MAG: DNA-3-methyladenine glycosylase, partial [Candidatus Bathyarchaeia archaeon]
MLLRVLPKEFYERDPAVVAKEMLGKILARKLGFEVLSGKIVETEAYYGENDPA